MDENIKWLIGLLVAVVGAIVTAIHNTRSNQSAATSALHKRIDDVHQNYVRRDDFAQFQINVQASLHRIEDKLDIIQQAEKL